VRSLAASALAIGLRPLCADFFEDSDLTLLLANRRGRFLGPVHSLECLPDLVKSVRSTVPLLWCGGLENSPDVLAELAARRPVIGVHPEVVRRVRDPIWFQQTLHAAGLSVPVNSLRQPASDHQAWLQKPFRSAGGLRITRLQDAADEQNANESADRDAVYWQREVTGVPMSAQFCATPGVPPGVRLLGTSLQLVGWPGLGATGFQFCGNAGPVSASQTLKSQLLTAARALVRASRQLNVAQSRDGSAVGLRGVFGLDFILRRGRAWFLEINPRITASHELYELQDPGTVLRQHFEAFHWSTPPRRSRRRTKRSPAHDRSCMARLIVWARESMIAPQDLRPWLLPRSSSVRSSVEFADIPRAGSHISAGSPLCSVIVRAESLPALLETVRRGFQKSDVLANVADDLQKLLTDYSRDHHP
jgi:predicted ATP-grasp superfamily ATP-dependent carboligase